MLLGRHHQEHESPAAGPQHLAAHRSGGPGIFVDLVDLGARHRGTERALGQPGLVQQLAEFLQVLPEQELDTLPDTALHAVERGGFFLQLRHIGGRDVRRQPLDAREKQHRPLGKLLQLMRGQHDGASRIVPRGRDFHMPQAAIGGHDLVLDADIFLQAHLLDVDRFLGQLALRGHFTPQGS